MSAAALLREAAALYDDPATRLADAAELAATRGLGGAAWWMRRAMRHVRGHRFPRRRRGGRVIAAKYAICLAVALLPAVVSPWWIFFSPALFYVAEVQLLFAVPLAEGGARRPLRSAPALTRRAGGTLRALRVVLPLATTMLLGGVAGRGFRPVVGLGLPRGRDLVRTPAGRIVTRWQWEFGIKRPMRLRHETVELGLPAPLRLLYASDLHLGRPWTRGVAPQLLSLARVARPDAVLLGGDLCDTPRGLARLARLVGRLAGRCPTLAVAGNHDRRLWPVLRPKLRKAGGAWLDGRGFEIGGVRIVGQVAPPLDGPTVLLAHDPAVFPQAAAAGCHLTLAGHLHGGQCVLFERGGRQFPGGWVNRWTGERFEVGGSTLLVSRGCGDTLPARLNCPREALLVTIT